MNELSETRPCCPLCGDVVGVYEPAVALTTAGTTHHTSLLALDREIPLAAIYHRGCFTTDD
jgi:hypothetical protein